MKVPLTLIKAGSLSGVPEPARKGGKAVFFFFF